MSRAECRSCGSRPCETPFPVERPRGMPALCLDCLLEWASEVTRPARIAETREALRQRGVLTRASYRARLRVRQRSPQADMVDLIVGSP